VKEIRYIIQDEIGLHARPAGQLVRLAGNYPCAIIIHTAAAQADAKRMLAVMKLGAAKGTELTITFDGEKEEEAAQAVETFLKENL
jgi:phosphocarrier protein